MSRIFVLTRNEQRVIILIVMLLVAAAILKRQYDESQSNSTKPTPTTKLESDPNTLGR